MEYFDVFYNGEKKGEVSVERDGLYYAVSCRCGYVHGLFRLALQNKKETVNIGVCIPEGNGIGIFRKVPARKMGDRPWHFVLTGEDNSERGVFVSLGGQLPTQCLRNLEKARFEIRNGCPGLAFPCLPEEN